MRRTNRFAILCAAAVASACAASSAAAAPIGFRQVAYGSASNGTLPAPVPFARIVRDAQSARALLPLWEMDRALPRAVAVDFTRFSLVVVMGDWGPNPAYSLLIGDITMKGEATKVTATLFRRPGIHADVTARPWTIVSVPARRGRRFTGRSRLHH